jgi:hypothetical protein
MESMNTLVKKSTVRRERSFSSFLLSNGMVKVEVVPELGTRIISLKNLRTEREWLWHPHGGLKLFSNQANDDFSKSPLVGVDECFPTIAPCIWNGRALPDHGELWSAAWQVDDAAWENSVLTTRLTLAVSPFRFERTIKLEGNEVHLNYKLTSHSDREEKFLWAFHPLLRLQPGDRLNLPESTRVQLNGADWVDAIDSAVPEAKHEKIFAPSVAEGWAGIHNPITGDSLDFLWNPCQNNVLGLWLTRGGWHGHDHFAIEPANANDDSLLTAAEQGRGGSIAPHGTVDWQLCLQVGC